jgi:hypothetical protein
VRPVANSIQANELAGHVKSHDLLVTIGGQRRGLQESNSNRVQGFERIAGTEQPFSTSEALARGDEFFQSFDVWKRQSERKTRLAQTTGGTRDLRVRDGEIRSVHKRYSRVTSGVPIVHAVAPVVLLTSAEVPL